MDAGDAPFTYDAYPRNHTITFKNGAPVTFSAAPAYKGDGSKGDPEDMLVAALSSCHMLSFLAIAAKKKIRVDSYQDDAVGFLENDGGKLWMTRVILRPESGVQRRRRAVVGDSPSGASGLFYRQFGQDQVTVEHRQPR